MTEVVKLTYTSPLEWALSWGPDQDGDMSYAAGTPFGSYSVNTRDGRWEWRYCFDEYYDEYEGECASLDEGKALAQANWDERIQPILMTRTALEQS